MNPQTTDELREFHQFLGDKLQNGGARLSPEEVLDEWRDSHPSADEMDAEVAAIQEALDDMAKGDHGRPAAEVLAELRSQHGLQKQ